MMNAMRMTPAEIINSVVGYPMLVRLPSLLMVVPKSVDRDAEVGKYNKMLTKYVCITELLQWSKL